MNDLVTDAPDIAANELVLAKNVAETLHKHYPNHLWAVAINGGMADIRNLALAGNWGFRLRVVDNYSDSEFTKRVVRAGGEMLERYQLSRGAARPDEIANLPTDSVGRVLGDLSK